MSEVLRQADEVTAWADEIEAALATEPTSSLSEPERLQRAAEDGEVYERSQIDAKLGSAQDDQDAEDAPVADERYGVFGAGEVELVVVGRVSLNVTESADQRWHLRALDGPLGEVRVPGPNALMMWAPRRASRLELALPRGPLYRLKLNGGRSLNVEAASGLRFDSITATTSAGPIAIGKVTVDALTLRSTSGDIAAWTAAKDHQVLIQSTSGNIAFGSAEADGADVRLMSTSGDVTWEAPFETHKLNANLFAQSGDISVELGATTSASVAIRTGSGDVRLGVPAQGALSLTRLGGSGKVKIELEGQAWDGRHFVRDGSGRLDISVSSSSGDLALRPTGAPRATTSGPMPARPRKRERQATAFRRAPQVGRLASMDEIKERLEPPVAAAEAGEAPVAVSALVVQLAKRAIASTVVAIVFVALGLYVIAGAWILASLLSILPKLLRLRTAQEAEQAANQAATRAVAPTAVVVDESSPATESVEPLALPSPGPARTRADVLAYLDAVLRRFERRLPDEVQPRVRAIAARLAEALPDSPGELALSDRTVYLVRQTALEFLPTTILRYVTLPGELAQRTLLANGKTARAELDEQLDLLEAEAGRLAEAAFRQEAEELLVQGRFLDEQFARSALQAEAQGAAETGVTTAPASGVPAAEATTVVAPSIPVHEDVVAEAVPEIVRDVVR